MDRQAVIYEFDGFRVDLAKAQAFRGGRPLPIEPKAFRVLVFLLEHPDRLIEKEELLAAAWQDTAVTDNALSRAIAQLRRLLGDDRRQAKYIETVPTRGYRFIAQVNIASDLAPDEPAHTVVSAQPERPNKHPARLGVLVMAAGMMAGGLVATALLGRSGQAPEPVAAQLTFSGGLEAFPTFSPDGSALAYSSDESGSFEIYVKQLTAGGAVIRLTHDAGQNLEPAWSPDGSLIAYVSEGTGGIWVIPALGGVPRQLATFGADPAWSPDSTRIVFTSASLRDISAWDAYTVQRKATLWTVSLRDGSAHQLTQPGHPLGAHAAATWARNGGAIAFTSLGRLWYMSLPNGEPQLIRTNFGVYDPVFAPDSKSIYASSLGNFGISQYPAPGTRSGIPSEGRRVFSSLPGHEFSRHPAVSADGQKIAFALLKSQGNLYSIPMQGENAKGPPVALTSDTRLAKSTPAISPDGRRILFSASSTRLNLIHAEPREGVNDGVSIINSDGSGQQAAPGSCDSGARWLPGGQDFACLVRFQYPTPKCKDPSCWGYDVWRVHLADRTRERILHLNQDAALFDYTRDGKAAAFMSRHGGPANIWTVSLPNGTPRQITFDAESMSWPSWSPDGQQIGVEAIRGDQDQVYLLKPGGQPVQLTHAKGQNWMGSWSPTGRQLVIPAFRKGVWNLWVVSTIDGSERQLTPYTRPNHFARYPDWSPNGSAIVYEYSETSGNIWTLDLNPRAR
jgi:Tol biopolymer transport system component/DNA-binding winged helix-turn-helix (wHTH) protein